MRGKRSGLVAAVVAGLWIWGGADAANGGVSPAEVAAMMKAIDPATLPRKVRAEAFRDHRHPRVFITQDQGEAFRARVRDVPWARKRYEELKKRIDPLVTRHATDPGYMPSRLQMHWDEGRRHTRFFAADNKVARREGDAPFPTVRVAYHRVATGSVPPPPWDRIEPYGDGSLFRRTGETWTRVPFEATGQGAETVNRELLATAYYAAVVHFVTGDARYARYAADVAWTFIRGASYQEQVNPDDVYNHHGYLSYETLGDGRHFATVALTYDLIHDYLMDTYFVEAAFRDGRPGERWAPPQPGGKRWAVERIGVMFQRMVDNKLTRGGALVGNWNNNEHLVALPYAFALEDDAFYANRKGREYYVTNLLHGPTTVGNGAYLDVVDANLSPATGLWGEAPGGYGQGSIAQLVLFGLWYHQNGFDVLGLRPRLDKGAMSFLQVAFPNGYVTGWGDSGYSRLDQTTAECMIAYARAKGERSRETICTALLAGERSRRLAGAFESPLFFYAAELDHVGTRIPYPRTSWSPELSLAFGRNPAPGDDPVDALAYTVYGFGQGSGHYHRNGMSMELYGRGEVQGIDPGAGPNYWHDQHNRYNNQVGAHNTVVPNGLGADRPQNLTVHHAEPPLEAGVDGGPRAVSADFQFTDTATRFTTFDKNAPGANQRRVMGIVRTGDAGGYYVDLFRSAMEDGGDRHHDYLYHNMGKAFDWRLADGGAPAAATATLSAESGRGYSFFATRAATRTDQPLAGVFDYGVDDVGMNVFVAGGAERTYFHLDAPANFRYYRRNMHGWPVPTLMVRQQGEAWNRPFLAVYEPTGRGFDGTVTKVSALAGLPPATAAGIEVVHRNGRVDRILHDLDGKDTLKLGDMAMRGHYGVVVGDAEGGFRALYLGEGDALSAYGLGVRREDAAKDDPKSSPHFAASLARLPATGEKGRSVYRYSATGDARVTLPSEGGTMVMERRPDGQATTVFTTRLAGGWLEAKVPAARNVELYVQ